MAFNWNQLLDFHVYLRRAAINQELIGGDARLLQIANDLLCEVEARQNKLKVLEDHIDDLEKKANEIEDDFIDQIAEAAALLSSIEERSYAHTISGAPLADDDKYKALVHLLGGDENYEQEEPHTNPLSAAQIDHHLNAILQASGGSALRHYSMEKTKADMRAAMGAAMSAAIREHTKSWVRKP